MASVQFLLKRRGGALLLLAAVLGPLAANTQAAQPKWTETVLYSFTGGAGGAGPFGTLVMDKSGNLYGVAGGGIPNCDNGNFGCGVVFMLTPSKNGWTETTLYSFTGGADGAYPLGGLILDAEGNLYGTASAGGTYAGGCSSYFGCGTVFKLTPAGTETVLHSFTGEPDGATPTGELVFDSQGNLYGTTSGGGVYDYGTVYEITSSGTESVLHSFNFNGTDGIYPSYAGLVLDQSGNLYGTTWEGGEVRNCPFYLGCGTVFEVTASGNETILHAFGGPTDGWQPLAGLVWDAQGNLWGTASRGGKSYYGGGTVFKVTLSGVETVAWSLNDHKNGGYPLAGLLWDAAGNLYGTAQGAGAYGSGTVFEISNKGRFVVPHAFGLAGDGFAPEGGLISDTTGHLYGTTYGGGAYGNGTVYMLTP